MGQVAPDGHQFVVVAVHEAIPGEVGVLTLGGDDGQIIPQRVGVVALQVIGQPDGPIAAGGHLLPLQGHELVGHHVVGQVERRRFVLMI